MKHDQFHIAIFLTKLSRVNVNTLHLGVKMRWSALLVGLVGALVGPATRADEAAPQSAVQSVAPEAAEAILGQRVTDQDGRDVGRLIDVLVDANGQPQAAVIDFGGFMGVGNRKVALHWSFLHFNPADPKHKVTLDMTPDQIKAAPEFLNTNKAAPVVTPADAAPTSP